ncbi:Egg cell-secreted protein 1.1 [Raphanus sativus]|uniref:Egg cell-secreted protein 1.1-like n=1 Tax=Raphanus sativus TaxID=3726 RepID=A0A6J0NCX4_RAPSA|nr:egg cell-secreted protein 1.1-like [Raphanus sativus]KAJ4909203.1 Egg cell-secreted protein 1.1 [Raphanus sativus]
MAINSRFVVAYAVTLMIMVASSTVTSRPLMKPTVAAALSPSTSLVYRLRLDEETGYCWDSLMQLQHCSGELILFFLNGETYIGPGCCSAIRTVGRKCWTTMIGVLGFTPQEGDVLQGYCDDDQDSGKIGDEHALASSPLPFSLKFKPSNVVRSSNP